jgi:hypothetical protein
VQDKALAGVETQPEAPALPANLPAADLEARALGLDDLERPQIVAQRPDAIGGISAGTGTAALKPGANPRVGPGHQLTLGVFGHRHGTARAGDRPPGQHRARGDRHHRLIDGVLPRFEQHHERFPWHLSGGVGVGGRECDLVLAWLVQGHGHKPRLGCHRPRASQNLDRPGDLGGIKRIERMARYH